MTRPESDAGFTMIELLVVLVIMPIVIGAIAAAIIISEQDSGVASSRLSDSASAQTISEYYVRDVQGAEYITTNSAASSPVNVCVDPARVQPEAAGAGAVPRSASIGGPVVGCVLGSPGVELLQLRALQLRLAWKHDPARW